MGIEYALAHDESGEAFELGKGPWSEWITPNGETRLPETCEKL
jgi:hypothetical protein